MQSVKKKELRIEMTIVSLIVNLGQSCLLHSKTREKDRSRFINLEEILLKERLREEECTNQGRGLRL